MGSSIRAALITVTGVADDLAGELMEDLLGGISYEIKLQALHIAEKVTGGDRRLSRFGTKRSRGKTRLGVHYEIVGSRSTINLTPPGMWAMTTKGSRPHKIGAGRRTKSGKYSKQRGGRPLLAIGGRVITGPVDHPGTNGRYSLDRVWAQIPRIVDEVVTDKLGEALNGHH